MGITPVGVEPTKQARSLLDLAINVKDYGASGSAKSTTGTMSSGGNALTLAAAEDFINGQGILVSSAARLPNPSTLTLAQASGSSSFSSGSTVYAVVSLLDASKNQTQVSPSASIAISATGNVVTTTIDLPDFTAFLNVFVGTASGPRLLATVTCSPNIDNPIGCTVTYSGGLSSGLTATQTAKTVTLTISAPASSTGSSEPTSNATVVPLVTTVSSGGGTTSLTLADAADIAVSGVDVYHDDTAAFNSAITAVSTAGGTIYVPPGTYMLSTALLINAYAVVMRGTYLSAYTGSAPAAGSILKATTGFTAGTPMLVIGASTGASEPQGILVQGIEFDCNNETAEGVWIKSAGRVTIERCAVYEPYYHGFFAAGAYNSAGDPFITFDTCYTDGGGTTQPVYGINGQTPGVFLMNACFYSTMLNCVATLPGGGAFAVQAGAAVSIVACKVNEIHETGATVWGFWLQGGNNHAITGCTTFTDLYGGCVVVSGVTSAAITANSFQGVNAANNAGAADNAVVYLQGAVDTIVSGNALTKGSHGVYSVYEDNGNGTPSGNRVIGNTLNGFTGTAHVVPYAGSGLTLAYNTNYNPVGVVTVTVPTSGAAVAAAAYDRTFYITTGDSSSTFVISGGPTVSPGTSGALVTVRVPAGQTLTPTYTTAPTWVVEGE